MYQGLLHLHNLLRWVILILLLVSLYRAITSMSSDRPFTRGDKRTGLFLMTAAHINFLIGLIQWSFGSLGLKNILASGMGVIMKDSVSRYWAIEHITGMFIAVALITVGRGVSKKNISDRSKHKRTFWFFFLALLIILVSVPWPFRAGIGRPWFPGM